MTDLTNRLEFSHPDQWRKWLEEKSTTEFEAWLILYKKKHRHRGLALEQAIEEALCFGWIDGKLISIDETKFLLRFSPRTAKSIWSISNIRRVQKLIGEGKMTEGGYQKITEAQENGQWEAAERREQVDLIPGALEAALKEVSGGLDAYRALPSSRKKQFIYWLQTAKREETRQKRVRQIVDEVINRSSSK